MSRSLDKDVLENLKSEDPMIVYNDIAKVLTTLPKDGSLLEIELLGKAHPLEPGANFLQEDNAVAIPKLRLTQAFFIARRVLEKHMASQTKIASRETIEATAVALLMDPEHLTAANIRKHVIRPRSDSNVPYEKLLRQEKQFLDSLLTARLHRHTKSPTLWSHRRWLMEQFKESGISLDYQQDFLAVIMVAAERHPRNYYAWHHARWLISTADLDLSTSLLMNIIDDVKIWCFKHHNDISGWTYLGFIINITENQEDRRRKLSATLAETLQMAESFRWANESVWNFLSTSIVRDGICTSLRESFLELNQKLLSSIEEDVARKPLRAAVQWACWCRQGVGPANGS